MDISSRHAMENACTTMRCLAVALKLSSKDLPVGAVQVTSKYGQEYQCTFPDHTTEEKKKEEEEKIAFETGIVEMLKPMGLSDCLFKAKDWWSYEFCYGKYIRQFHMEDGEIKGNIIYLGYYQDDFDWNNETAREERLKSAATLHRYHSQTYALGTKCDLTGEMRRAEVRFMCEENSEDYLARVDESETCVYTVTVMTSRICRHPYLKAPAKRRPVAITCNPLLSEDQYKNYIQEQEEEKLRKERLQAEAKSTLKKEATSSLGDWEDELTKTLEDEMSATAKELLGKPVSESFPFGQRKEMTKEEFQAKFGPDESIWQLYHKSFEVSRQLQDVREKRMAVLRKHLEKKGNVKNMQAEGEEEGQEVTEEDAGAESDEEILSEFDEEIKTIKASFKSSQNKLSNIKRKLTLERNWESEIENAIKEAEEELGVKVDRSLISGLSNTLDKLVNKLHDTERELSSMDREIGKLKPGKKVLIDSKEGEDVQDDVEAVGEEEDDADEDSDNEERQDERRKERDDIFEVAEEEVELADARVIEGEDAPEQWEGGEDVDDLEDKIQAPPKLASKSSRPSYLRGKNDDEDETAETDAAKTAGTESDKGEEKPEIEITLKKLDGEDDVDLPKDVQKLLEESVKKEFEKHRMATDPQPLTFDADHSFNREKTVHVIQQEDEDGKTNRYIFVFGFNAFSDESAESERQSALEDNYSFVYKGKQNKKQSDTES